MLISTLADKVVWSLDTATRAVDLNDASLSEVFNSEKVQLARRVIRDGQWCEQDGETPCTGCRRVTAFAPKIAELGHQLGLEEA